MGAVLLALIYQTYKGRTDEFEMVYKYSGFSSYLWMLIGLAIAAIVFHI